MIKRRQGETLVCNIKRAPGLGTVRTDILGKVIAEEEMSFNWCVSNVFVPSSGLSYKTLLLTFGDNIEVSQARTRWC